MICRRFSSFRFRFSVFKVVLSGSSSFIEAISLNTKYLQNGHKKLYYACPFKAANIAFFQLWSPITSQCPFLRPPIRFNTLYCCNRPMLYLTPSSVMPSIASATSCRVAVGCSCRYFMIFFWVVVKGFWVVISLFWVVDSFFWVAEISSSLAFWVVVSSFWVVLQMRAMN